MNFSFGDRPQNDDFIRKFDSKIATLDFIQITLRQNLLKVIELENVLKKSFYSLLVKTGDYICLKTLNL
ncbi:hypothetical protein [Leptospira santarosai]|uniref:Uncharacterized protein n=4 Tax=Leptospira santarosai TaxID=28183 RepID=A0AB73LN40_9LEPT|nr:hypothetical protein [Leptospira santarosai]EKT86050.1 hypothetical protein LSS_14411 [Leptospira santarosai serovar Shermani str. LT 821]EMN22797.1 hypothetical protein LEP1GSC063_1736 [Leptospira santarosai serovar Arenal str. MAVJ 401]OLY58912.1 hypothetical protein BV917_18295 [Leptospira santarosai serovar Guaricura]OLY65647.1 hypothetical protein BWD11_03890 [Leptospira santarosai serovar Grippotyphosa]ONF81059.1 hypothetical protein BWD12_02615 [Leptospira santarosai serovar Bananal]